MQKWEFKAVKLYITLLNKTQETLDTMAADGWDLVCVVGEQYATVAFFKRPKR